MPRFKNNETGEILEPTDKAVIQHFTVNSNRYTKLKDEPKQKEEPKKKDK